MWGTVASPRGTFPLPGAIDGVVIRTRRSPWLRTACRHAPRSCGLEHDSRPRVSRLSFCSTLLGSPGLARAIAVLGPKAEAASCVAPARSNSLGGWCPPIARTIRLCFGLDSAPPVRMVSGCRNGSWTEATEAIERTPGAAETISACSTIYVRVALTGHLRRARNGASSPCGAISAMTAIG